MNKRRTTKSNLTNVNSRSKLNELSSNNEAIVKELFIYLNDADLLDNLYEKNNNNLNFIIILY